MKYVKNQKATIFLLTVLFVGFTTATSFSNQSGLQIPDQISAERIEAHLLELTENIGPRSASTPEEIAAGEYIAGQFEAMGYVVEIQPFEYGVDTDDDGEADEFYVSNNIIATKKGKFDQTVIIGAHYDSVEGRSCGDGNLSTGAGDNASGVAVMLETAEVLANYKTLGTIKFVAFGAEELGLHGSFYYADQMSEEEVANTVTMINLDSVGAGDFLYAYSGVDENPGWARDLALNIGQYIGLDIRTSPDSEYFVGGTTGDWSDHVPFRYLGVPIVYFEWMNWDIEPDGGIETEEFGWIMHTCRDNLSFTSIEKVEQTAQVVAALTFSLSKTKLPKTVKGKIAKGNKYRGIQKRNNRPD